MTANPIPALRLMQIAERAFDESDNIIAVLEPAGPGLAGLRIVGANGAFCRAFAMTPDEAAGRTLAALADEANEAALSDAIADAVAGRRPLRTEMRCRRADGVGFWLGLHLMPSTDPVTGRSTFVLLGRDITERKSDGAQQKAIQQVLAGVFLSVDAAVLITSPEGRILMNNPRVERILGYPPGGLVGMRTGALVAPCAYAATMQVRDAALANREDYRLDTIGLRHDGSEIPMHICSVMGHGRETEQFRIVTVRERAAGLAAPVYRVAGMIKLIGLDEVKAALGPRWHEVEDRANRTAEHVIQRALHTDESFTRAQDGGFVICFAGRSEEEASFTAATIGRRIRERLLGQGEDLAALQVTAIAARVDLPEAVAEPAGKIDLAGLLERRLNARRLEIEARARRTLTEAMAETRCLLVPVQARDGLFVVGHYAAIPRRAYRTMLSAHAALPADEQVRFNLDAAMLGLAADRLQQDLLSDPVGAMFIDVDYAVFQARAATQGFIETCRSLSPALRRRVILVLSHLPPAIAGSRLQDCVQRLRPFCRGVAFAIDDANLGAADPILDQAPIIAVGTDRVTGAGSEERLARLLAAVHGKHGRLLARDVPDAPTAALLRAAGVDLLALQPA